MKIGIGITAKNRHESTAECLLNIRKHSKGCRIVLVDDGSDTPCEESDFRFEKSVGIAVAKNKCLELLDDCDYIFLYDNDCWPIVGNWYQPYIEAYKQTGCHHLSFTFSELNDGRQNGNKAQTDRGELVEYHNACGCMIFITKECLKIAGGFNPEYGHYGYEHTDYSTRINNLGLTPHRFCDIPNSLSLFHSQDYYREVETTVKGKQQRLRINSIIYSKNIKSKKYIPYKPLKTAIITTYFVGVDDPQKGGKWVADHSLIDNLINSMNNQKLIILNDCFDEPDTENVKYIKCIATENPYFQRWISILKYLSEENYDYVFCVDATDVVMINNPFKTELGGYLYVGNEKQNISCKWLKDNHNDRIKDQEYHDFYNKNHFKNLLNAGILGGKSEVVKQFIGELVNYYNHNDDLGLTDMAAFNFIAHSKFGSVLRKGPQVNTEFKKFDTKNRTAFFRHK